MLTLKTFRKFGITSDPFTGDVVKADDVYLTDETRFIADYLLQTERPAAWSRLSVRAAAARRPYAVMR